MIRFQRTLIILATAVAAAPTARVAAQTRTGAVALDQSLVGITSTARVLLIAAHPDDEDTQALAWLTRGKHVETAYLSLTRGDGGQNLIGPELGDALGAIRTEELLAARRIDGGRQFFTRAYDFGFSKNAGETAKHWPRDSILGDVVTVIRSFRPHVVYSVWSGTRADGHGHHEYAGQIARAAFDAAGDTVRFPVARYGPAWTPVKFYRRGAGGIALPVNDYDPVIGKTYAAIAAESRSQHRSQGFGGIALGSIVPGAGGRGFFGGGIRLEASTVAGLTAANDKGVLDGVDTSYARLVRAAPPAVQPRLHAVVAQADSANRVLDLARPWTVLPFVARLASAVHRARAATPVCMSNGRVNVAGVVSVRGCSTAELDLDAALSLLERRADRALLAAAELEVDATAPRELVAIGDSLPVTVAVVNHGHAPVRLEAVSVTGAFGSAPGAVTIAPDSGVAVRVAVHGYPALRPWWLLQPRGEAMLATERSPADGRARAAVDPGELVPGVAVSEEARRMSDVVVTVEVAGEVVPVRVGEVIHREADPLLGVQDQPVGGVPPVTVSFDGALEYVVASKPVERTLRMTLKSFAAAPRTFALALQAPPGLTVDSVPPSVTLAAGEQREVFLRVRGSVAPGKYELRATGRYADGSTFNQGFTRVNYPHVRPLYMYRDASVTFEAVDVAVAARLNVAYIPGVGDNTPGYLRQLGIPVTVLQPGEVASQDLSQFTTVVTGTRAFDASAELVAAAPRLMEFVRNGGTLVMQYGQRMDLVPGVFPYPLAWQSPAERATVEDVPVTVLDPASPLLRVPNVLGAQDWAGWVQERALYMPSTIDPRYSALVEMHDPGEKENRGAILTARVGKGTFVFTTLSLFRQVPGGVAGSIRLWVNLLSAGAGR